MNANEIQSLEEHLGSSIRLPVVTQAQIDEVVRRAKHERAIYVAESMGRLIEWLAGFGRQVRDLAAACTQARLARHG